MEHSKQIIVSGGIGVGKTTLISTLQKHFSCEIASEPVGENPYLSDFYACPEKYAFQMQVFLATCRYEMHLEAQKKNVLTIFDRGMADNNVFALMLKNSQKMDQRDFDSYMAVFNNLYANVKTPACIIYLKTDPKVAYERIKKRGRECEMQIPFEYIVDLHKHYEMWINEMAKTNKIITIDYNQFIPVSLIIADIEKLIN